MNTIKHKDIWHIQVGKPLPPSLKRSFCVKCGANFHRPVSIHHAPGTYCSTCSSLLRLQGSIPLDSEQITTAGLPPKLDFKTRQVAEGDIFIVKRVQDWFDVDLEPSPAQKERIVEQKRLNKMYFGTTDG